MKSPIYGEDFLLWAEQQAALLRAGNLSALDTEGLADELESLALERKSTFQTLIRKILAHLLRLEYAQESDRREAWLVEISEFRVDAETMLEFTRSIATYADALYMEAWPQARRAAAVTLQHSPAPVALPTDCPYTLENVLDYDFCPAARVWTSKLQTPCSKGRPVPHSALTPTLPLFSTQLCHAALGLPLKGV